MTARINSWSRGVAVAIVFASWAAAQAFSEDTAPDKIATEAPSEARPLASGLNPDMKLEDLVKQDVVIPAMSTVVTTVDRQVKTIGRSPAAVFVITPEMIKRSGVRNIPEALRMAPGLDVARIDASTWAISCAASTIALPTSFWSRSTVESSTTRPSEASTGTCRTLCWRT